MKQGVGIPVYPGVAIGKAVVYRKQGNNTPVKVEAAPREQEKFNAAVEVAKSQLMQLYKNARATLGEEQAAIVEVQLLMLEDPDYLEAVADAISAGDGAAVAAAECGERIALMFAGLEDSYMQARAADIRDVSGRVAGVLRGDRVFSLPEGKFILVAEDLAPSETIQLPRERILAFVTRQGSYSSHTAILARTLNIPSLVQADITLDDAENCGVLAVDGETGAWHIDPDGEILAILQKKQNIADENRAALEKYRGKKSITKSGKTLLLYANIGSPEDAQMAMLGDAEGVGLMRSEFLYLGRTELPSEEELFTAYKKVAEIMQDRPVIIRTLDIGADKQAEYLHLPMEENPALGLRGLRLCMDRPDIFRTQLRAIYRASAYGNLSMMFPMVASVWELRKAKAFCEEIRKELSTQGILTGEVPIGVMVETPAAALMAETLAEEADFFSVGTNDLTQYTLAVDRQNAALDAFYDPYHPAVLSLMAHIAACARKAGIWAGVCGELGADPKLTEKFLEMGYKELSMAPGCILEIRKIICESEV